MSDQNVTVSKDTRVVWMAWCDEDEGWIAALYGSTDTKQEMQENIERIAKQLGRNDPDSGVRPVRVTVELQS